jgi:hypothetical protein
MQKSEDFSKSMQQYLAITTVGPSTLRNQGSKGVINAVQEYLAKNNLCDFNQINESEYLNILNKKTEELKEIIINIVDENKGHKNKQLNGRQHWGAARKSLNLFLREIFFNKLLGHKIEIKEEWMEIPLDSFIAKALNKASKKFYKKVITWPGLKRLDFETNRQFQMIAKDLSSKEFDNISRIRLDIRLWIDERETQKRSD